MADPFSMLIDAIKFHKPISLLDSTGKTTDFGSNMSQPEYISFTPSHCYYLNTPVPIATRSQTGDNFYTIGAAYFQYLKQHLPFSEYLKECRALNIPHVAIIDRKLVLQALNGVTEGLTPVEMTPALFSMIRPRSIDEISEPEQHQSAGIEETHIEAPLVAGDAIEKPNFLPNAPFLSKNKNYASVISNLRSFLKKKKSTEENQVMPKTTSGTMSEGTKIPTGTASSLLPMDISTVNPRELLSQMKSDEKKPRPTEPLPLVKQESTDPIIIVPFSTTSTINIYNVKPFLEESRYIDPVEAKNEANGKKSSTVAIKRCKGKDILTYIVTDAATKLSPNEWSRTIAVFAQGASWQFKDWPKPYNSPTELFNLIQGFHLKHDGVELDGTVKGWNVRILNVHRTRPHLNLETVASFWTAVDNWLTARGLVHSATGGFRGWST